jgi:RimJ/RimL family protein N-acetyltransferase
MNEHVDPWPLRRLSLRTPRLELRPDDDDGLFELAEEAELGVHPPQEMPFTSPWTDAPPEDLAGNVVRYYWQARAGHRPDNWKIHFLVRLDGRVIGTQQMRANDFSVTRQIGTGSWIGLRNQGNGYGKEMRAAVLMLAFDHLGARSATTEAFTDNPRSLGVSKALGYLENGTKTMSRRGIRAGQTELLLTGDRFAAYHPQWTLTVVGLPAARQALGL